MRLSTTGFLLGLVFLLTACGGTDDLGKSDSTPEVDTGVVADTAVDAPADLPEPDVGQDSLIISDDPCRVCTWNPTDGEQCTVFEEGTSCSNPADCCTTKKQCVACEAWEEDCPFYGVTCRGTEFACEDEDQCTEDECECVEGIPQCDFPQAPDGSTCEVDPPQCTNNDYCEAGECVAGESLLTSDNLCILKECVEGEVIATDLHGKDHLCDDDDPCTDDDHCNIGTCIGGKPVVCEKPLCASSTVCVPFEGCESTWLPVGAVCDDENVCTTNDACDSNHECVGAMAVNCDDGDPCTLDECDPGSGECLHALQQGAPCNDGDLCTVDDQCLADGSCSGSIMDCSGVSDPCLQQVCNPGTGACNLPVDDGISCDDGNPCNGAEACVGGVCQPSEPIVCVDDENPCTEDTCNPQTGLCGVPVENGAACLDDDLCNGDETCQEGVCAPGTPMLCDDGNPCTTDTCHPVHGCMLENNSAPCSDGDPYTVDDFCQGGSCVGIPADIEVADNLKLPESSPSFVDVTVEDGLVTMEFSGPADASGLQPGDIVVGARDGGYLAWVDEVVFQGNIAYIETSPATLSDAILDGEFSSEIPPGYEDIAPDSGARGGPITVALEMTHNFSGTTLFQGAWGGAQVAVEVTEGWISFTPSLTLDGYVKWGPGDYFLAKVAGDFAAWLDVLASASAELSMSEEVSVYEAPSKSFFFSIAGVVPVWGTVEFELLAGFELEASATGSVTAGVDVNASVEAGAEFANETWSPIWNKSLGGQYHAPTFETGANVGLRPYIRPEVHVFLYKAVGPGIAIEPYLDFQADMLPPPSCWSVDAGVKGDLLFDVEILGIDFYSYSNTLVELVYNLVSDCFECGDDTCQITETPCFCPQDCGQCEGCCSGLVCLGGATPLACGTNGATCQACGVLEECNNGQCEIPGPDCNVVCVGMCGIVEGCDCGECACVPNTACCDAGGQPLPNGTSCGVGKYCSNGVCETCPSDWCQNNGHGSGQYCMDASTLVTCTTQGACFSVANTTNCPNGCSGSACNPAPTCGDSSCNNGENKCSCPNDCGTHSGCCSPSDQELPGTSNDYCGKNGNDCVACGAGKYCNNGTCVTCDQDFCQINGYSSGNHCNGNMLVTCAWDGACKYVSNSQVCPNGCQAGACTAAPYCGDLQCNGSETTSTCCEDCGCSQADWQCCTDWEGDSGLDGQCVPSGTPSAPLLSSPSDSVSVAAGYITFDWQEVYLAHRYWLSVCSNPDVWMCDKVAWIEPEPGVTAATVYLGPGTYWWSVRSIRPCDFGGWGPYASQRKLTVY